MNCSPYLRLVHDYASAGLGQLRQGAYRHDHVLHYFKSGHGCYRCASAQMAIEPGLMAIHAPGSWWSFQLAPDSGFHMLNIIFDVVERADSYYSFPRESQLPRPNLESFECVGGDSSTLPEVQLLLAPVEYETLFAELHAAVRLETIQSRLRRKALIMDILALAYRNASETLRDGDAEHERIVASAAAILRDHAPTASTITLAELAVQLAVSRSLLCRIFPQRMGVSPMKYLMRLKIERAQVELIFNSHSIKETAEMLGFANVHHFTCVFHRHAGFPPGEFLRRHRAAADSPRFE